MNTVVELSRRNGASAMEALRNMEIRIAEQQQRIDGLNETVATLTLRLQQVETFIALQRVAKLGTGPTVK